jgi:hypothetical protein
MAEFYDVALNKRREVTQEDVDAMMIWLNYLGDLRTALRFLAMASPEDLRRIIQAEDARVVAQFKAPDRL